MNKKIADDMARILKETAPWDGVSLPVDPYAMPCHGCGREHSNYPSKICSDCVSYVEYCGLDSKHFS